MKILPPSDEEKIYAWIVLPLCIVFLIGALVLGAVWDTWGQGGIYENLFAELIGVSVEVGVIYLLISKLIERRDKRLWHTVQTDLVRRLEDLFVDVLMAADAVLDAQAREDEEEARAALTGAERATREIREELVAKQAALPIDVVAHLSSFHEASRECVVSISRFSVSYNSPKSKTSNLWVRGILKHALQARAALFEAANILGLEDHPVLKDGFPRELLIRDIKGHIEARSKRHNECE